MFTQLEIFTLAAILFNPHLTHSHQLAQIAFVLTVVTAAMGLFSFSSTLRFGEDSGAGIACR